MGWSHGGFITSHILFRDDNPFKAGAAIVPVTNLVFRLVGPRPGLRARLRGRGGIQGLPFESNCGPQHDHACIDVYLKRSPVFHAENLKVPMLVHVATNDCDVFFREDQQMVYTLRALKPELAETKIYKDPPVGARGLRTHLQPARERRRRSSATIRRSRSIPGIGRGRSSRSTLK